MCQGCCFGYVHPLHQIESHSHFVRCYVQHYDYFMFVCYALDRGHLVQIGAVLEHVQLARSFVQTVYCELAAVLPCVFSIPKLPSLRGVEFSSSVFNLK